MLIILLNKAVKLSSDFLSLDKEYITLVKLGIRTDSHDLNGRTIKICEVPRLEESYLSDIINDFEGDYSQTIPVFSAKKIKGRHLYEYARKNIETDKIKNNVRINKISIIKFQPPDLYLRISVSSGTYIRAIANDIGERIGCGAAMAELKRVRIGDYFNENAFRLEEALNFLSDYYDRKINEADIKKIKSLITLNEMTDKYKKVYVDERFLGILERNSPLYEEMVEPRLNSELEFEPGEIIIIKTGKYKKSYFHRAVIKFSLKKISDENKKLSKFLLTN